MAKILLLGGTGTLSSAVLNIALEKSFEVSVMNRGKRGKKLPDGVDSIICDFKDVESLKLNFANCHYDVVVDFLSRNKEDIRRVYPIFINHCTQYIFISSACVFRRNSEDFPIKENSPKPNKNWNYNVTKFECEQELISLSSRSNTSYTIVRPYITYDDERIPLGITPSYKYHRTILERIRSGKPWFIWDGGKAITTVTHTIDFARGVVGLFLNEKARNEDFNIVSNYQYSQKEVVNLLYSKLGFNTNIVDFSTSDISVELPMYRDMLIGDRALDAVFDNNKIIDAVPDLKFTIDLQQGLDRIIKHWENLESYEYDYEFDALIDKMISSKGYKATFVKYKNSPKGSKRTYFLYRYLPYQFASRINSLLS